MNIKNLVIAVSMCLAPSVFFTALVTAETTKPNIILIMTDDQGYGEVGFHGNKVLKTPNLDRFAVEGTELTNFYVSPMCTPTRSSLMTGRYHFRTGAHDTYIGRSNMNPQETTIAEVFAGAGYRTGIFGKWHLGENYPMRAADQGFQKVVVHGGGGIGQFADYPKNSYWNPTLLYNDTFKKSEGYCTDVFIDESLRFIENNRNQPFFCYVPLNIPHSPFVVGREFREGYDKQDLVDPDGRNWVAPIYGMITQFDGAFQRLLDAVDEMGLKDNTIIIFMTDNGPNSVFYTAGLRARKGSVYENGIRSPFVIQWPNGMKGGRKFKDPVMHIDLLPTLADACGIQLPAKLKVDGKSILRLLTGEVKELPERYLFMQHNRANVPIKFSNCMVRKGPWKAVQTKRKQGDFELYNIEQDPGERKNLAAQHPDKVKAFVREYETWFDDVTAELQRNEGMPHPIELNPVQKQDFRFTWQDWWGEKTGWRPTNYGRWRMNNPGLIDRFDITIVPRQHQGMEATVKFIWQGKTVVKTYERLPARVELENFELAKGKGFMEAQIHAGGKMWGVQEVQIRAHSAMTTARPPGKPVTNSIKDKAKPQLPTRSVKLPAVRGQFVRIELPGKGRVLSLAEVEVFEKGINLALKKKATQSTVAFAGAPARAVDGDTDGDYLNGSVSHTATGENPFWEVDLDRMADVEEAIVYNRTDSHGQRLHGFTLKILDAKRKVVFSKEKIPQSAIISFLRPGVKLSQVGQPANRGPRKLDATKANAFPGEKTDFHGFDMYRFRIDNNRVDVKIVCPEKAALGKPWLWRSLFWEAISRVHQADLKLVEQGYHVVLVHGDVAGHPSGNANIDAAYDLLTSEYGFSKKCSMASMSRGTLSLFRWASANPEKVESIYVDNGVCNVLSWPAGKLVPGSGSKASGAPGSWKDFKRKFGYATDEEALKTKESPIDQLEPLAKAGVPILMVCGNKDTAVPYEENDAIMEQRYKALGGSIKVIVEDKGHSHGMRDPTPVLEFIRKHTRPLPETGQAVSPKGPNIVFLMTDDQRWDTFGCYGRTDVKTPHIDKLAAQGVVFDNAHYAVAICMPSRATMFTGRYLSDHQVGFTYPYNRTLPKEEFADSYPARLRAAGYRTGFVGKFGIRLESTPNTAAEHFDFFAVGGMRWPKDDAELHHIYRPERPKEERTIKKGDAMIRFLETQPKGQPFCLSISFDAVKNDRDHDMYSPHVEIFKDKDMFVPGNWVEGKNHRLPKLLDHWRGTGLHMHYTATPELYQTLARRFATQGYTVDQQVGRLMAKLEEMGVLNNTIVIYTSDNGRFHGSHGLFDKAILYEESMKAPLVVFNGRASKDQRGRREDALISSADMAPTILSLAGLEVPDSMKGHDFSGVLNGWQDMSAWQDVVFMESLFIGEIHSAGVRKHKDIPGLSDEIIAGNRSYRCRGVRTERWKYFVYYEHTPAIEELYDLKADPLEQNNLASDGQHSEILSKLRDKTQELYAHATE